MTIPLLEPPLISHQGKGRRSAHLHEPIQPLTIHLVSLDRCPISDRHALVIPSGRCSDPLTATQQRHVPNNLVGVSKHVQLPYRPTGHPGFQPPKPLEKNGTRKRDSLRLNLRRASPSSMTDNTRTYIVNTPEGLFPVWATKTAIDRGGFVGVWTEQPGVVMVRREQVCESWMGGVGIHWARSRGDEDVG